MRRDHVRDLLQRVADGSVDVSKAMDALSFEPVESLGFATIDHHRALRQGFPEVIYGAGKTPQQIVAIAERIAAHGDGVLVTRASEEAAAAVMRALPGAEHNATARTVHLRSSTPSAQTREPLLVVTAGTSDLPVAEEAAVTAGALGCR